MTIEKAFFVGESGRIVPCVLHIENSNISRIELQTNYLPYDGTTIWQGYSSPVYDVFTLQLPDGEVLRLIRCQTEEELNMFLLKT